MIYEPLGKFVRLSQGLAVNKGTSYLFSNYKTDEFIYPLLRIVDLESGNHSTFSKYVSKDVSKSVVISEDTIVFSRVTCQCFRGFSGVVHNNLFVVEPINDFVSKDYLFTILQSSFVRNQALNLAKSSVVPDLTHDMFKSIRIPIPEKSEQNKIVAVYQSISSKISNNNAICADLEGMAKDLYDYWFVQFDFPDENGKPYKSSGGKMVWNEELKREIPEGWEATNIGAITICHDSERIPVSGEKRKMMIGSIPYYGATEIMGHVNKAIFNGDYVLLAEDGSVMDDSGHPIIQRISGPSWVNNHAHVLEPEKTYSCRLLMMILKDIPVVQIKTGSIQWKINQENLNKYKIANIPSALRALAVLKLEPIDSMLLDLKKENEELTSLRDFLLPMLLNGQVKVKGA